MGTEAPRNPDAAYRVALVLKAFDQLIDDMKLWYESRLESELRIDRKLKQLPDLLPKAVEEALREIKKDRDEAVNNPDGRYIARVTEVRAFRELFVDAPSLNVIPLEKIKELEVIFRSMIIWGMMDIVWLHRGEEKEAFATWLPKFRIYLEAATHISPPSERDPQYPMDF